MNMQALANSAQSLVIYGDLLQTDVLQHWVQLVKRLARTDDEAPQEAVLTAYSKWIQALAATGHGWQDEVFSSMLTAVNPLTQMSFTTSWVQLPPALKSAVQHDLRGLQLMYQCRCDAIRHAVQQIVPDVPLADWADQMPGDSTATQQGAAADKLRSLFESCADWADASPDLVEYYQAFGTGMFAQYYAFRWRAGELQGVVQPDPIRLANLVGYDWQQAALVQNTKALLAGYTGLNVLLYGSRGSGKSSVIKALINEFGDEGLRLVEVSKAYLSDLPDIVEQLRQCPQKFIIFVDDLSFEEDDDAFKALKVVLEGGLTARPENVVVYATSNRRHLIREFYGDRPRPKDADEIHQWDTMQEKMSFSDRFGLTLTFEPAAQPTYLQIVQHLAQAANLTISGADLEFRALQWATQQNGRSGRTARQFIDYLTADLALGGEL